LEEILQICGLNSNMNDYMDKKINKRSKNKYLYNIGKELILD
jgi:hypothetical protein